MKAFDTLTTQRFEDPTQLLNYFENNQIIFKVDPDTKDRIYVINPDSKRSYVYLAQEDKNKQLYLSKI